MKTAEAHNAGLWELIEDASDNPLQIAVGAYRDTIDALIKMGEDKDAEIAALKSRIAELEKQLEGKEDEQGR